jgi:hypothetical protein
MPKLLLFILLFGSFTLYAQTPRYSNAIKIGGNQFEMLDQIEIDKDGSRYLKITTRSPVLIFGSSNIPASGPLSSIVVKLDKNNQIIWQVRSAIPAGGDYSIFPINFYMDAQDNTYLTIYHTQSVTILGHTILFDPTLGTFHYSTIKISKNNQVVWTKKSPKYYMFSNFTRLNERYTIFLRQSGFPKDTINEFILSDTTAYILKVDTSGKLVNARSLGKFQGTYNPITCTQDRIYFIGSYANNSVEIDSTFIQVPPALQDQTHGFVASIDTNFQLKWVRRSTCPPFEIGGTRPNVVIPASDGGVWVAGPAYSTGSVLFDSISVINEPPSTFFDSNENFYLVHYSREGKATMARIFGSNRPDYLNGLSEDSLGNLIVAGFSSGSFTIDDLGSPIADEGPFILKLDKKNLRAKWLKSLPGGWRNIVDVKTDNMGNIFSQGNWSFYPNPSDTPPLALDNFTLPLTPSGQGFPQQSDLFLARLGNCNLSSPSLSAMSTQTICQGDSLTLSCSSFQKYQWSTSDTSQTITIKKPGRYHCYIYDSLGCYAKSNVVEVKVNQPTASAISQSICPGSSFLGYSQTGTYKDTLTGSNGCDSIRTLTLSIKPIQTKIQTVNLCQGQSLQVGTRIYSTAGIYKDTLTAANGCDSIITSTLNYSIPNDTIIANGLSYSAADNQDSYQWLDCNQNFQAIAGATQQSFTPTSNGSYAVKTTKGNCADTSNCLLFTSGKDLLNSQIRIYPQPVKDKLFIDMPETGQTTELVLLDALGRIVFKEKGRNIPSISVSKLPAGLYQLKIFQGNQVEVFGVMVER